MWEGELGEVSGGLASLDEDGHERRQETDIRARTIASQRDHDRHMGRPEASTSRQADTDWTAPADGMNTDAGGRKAAARGKETAADGQKAAHRPKKRAKI
ncbi:hypothetical protein JCM3770_001296 [Rhodotorula araucariae]